MKLTNWTIGLVTSIIRAARGKIIIHLMLSVSFAAALFTFSNEFQQAQMSMLQSLSLGVLLVIAIRALLGFHQNFAATEIVRNFQGEFSVDLSRKAHRISNQYSAQEIYYRLTHNIQSLIESISYGILNLMSSLILSASALFYIAYHEAQIIPLGLGLMSAGFLVSYAIQKIISRFSAKHDESESRVFKLQKHLLEGSEHIHQLNKIFSWRAKLDRELDTLKKMDMKLIGTFQFSQQLNWAVRFLFVAILTTPLLILELNSPVVMLWVYILIGAASQFLQAVSELGQVKVHAQKSFDVLSANETKDRRHLHTEDAIFIENLRLYYGQSAEKGIGTFNLCWRTRERIWMDGVSGSGKTTFAKALLGLHDNFTGTISVPKNFKIYYHSQNPYFFENESLADNLGIQKLKPQHLKLIEELQLTDCFQRFNYNLNHALGSNGHQFSKGQLTRLAVFRTLINKYDFYIFDEPTASLDQDNSIRVIETIMRHLEEKMILILEHNLSLKSHFEPQHLLRLETKSTSFEKPILTQENTL